MTLENDVAAWKDAKTIKELGELTARWLEGAILYQPGYVGDPDEETLALVQFLAPLNRAAFYTTNSQPGRPIADGCGQRAWIEGFCEEQLAKKISATLLMTDLVVIATPPGATSDVQICITVDDGEEFTRVGGPMELRHIVQEYQNEVDVRAVGELITAWQLCIIDSAWGRNDLLWPRLLAAVQ